MILPPAPEPGKIVNTGVDFNTKLPGRNGLTVCLWDGEVLREDYGGCWMPPALMKGSIRVGYIQDIPDVWRLKTSKGKQSQEL